VQGEIKVAKLASQKLGLNLSDRELVAMVTTNPGDALARCWKKTSGRLVPGSFGDITIFRATGNKPVWSQIVESTEREVMLAVCAGIPRYGDAELMVAAGRTESSLLVLNGLQRRFAIPDPDNANAAWSWKDITGRLDAVRKDPVAALKHAEGRRRAYAGPLDAADAPLELVLDMPSGGAPLAGDVSKHAAEIKIPPLPSLLHDDAFFKAVKAGGFHAGLLDGLAEFYA